MENLGINSNIKYIVGLNAYFSNGNTAEPAYSYNVYSWFSAIVELNLVPFAFISLLFYPCYSRLLLSTIFFVPVESTIGGLRCISNISHMPRPRRLGWSPLARALFYPLQTIVNDYQAVSDLYSFFSDFFLYVLIRPWIWRLALD